jgi:L-threonylcarbamoyladenylate synthase
MVKTIKMKSVKQAEIVKRVKNGEIFIYPTDTIYGIGCNALDEEAVRKIRQIKQRTDKPFSVIAPSKQWLTKNFKVKRAYVEKLPGPFTYILKPKKKGLLGEDVSSFETIGVRIPDHPFTKMLQKAKVPFITTSVNITGEEAAIDLARVSPLITEQVDLIIDDGILNNRHSTVLDLTGSLPKIIRK